MAKFGAYKPGFTRRTVVVPPSESCLPDVAIVYRPLPGTDQAVVLKRFKGDDPLAQSKEHARLIEDRVKEWDMVYGDGSPVPIKAEDIMRDVDGILIAAIGNAILQSAGEAEAEKNVS